MRRLVRASRDPCDEAREIANEDPALIHLEIDGPEIRPDETRVCVDGLEIPPYNEAVAFIRNTEGEYGIRFHDGATNWLGTAGKAFGEYDAIKLHPSEQ